MPKLKSSIKRTDMFGEEVVAKPVVAVLQSDNSGDTVLDEMQQPISEKELQVFMVDIDRLHPYGSATGQLHPFKLLSDQELFDLGESIATNGLINPITVRPMPDGNGYEIISGHNRVEACRRRIEDDIKQIRAIVKNVDDEAAAVLMVDANLNQRKNLLPSELAFALKIRHDAEKKQGKRTDLTLSENQTMAKGTRTDSALAEELKLGRASLNRLKKLADLIRPLLDLVDSERIQLGVAYDLSFLSVSAQTLLLQFMGDKIVPNSVQSANLKDMSEKGLLDGDGAMAAIAAIMSIKPEAGKSVFTAKDQALIRNFFPQEFPKERVKEITIRAVEQYLKDNPNVLEAGETS